MIHSARGFDGSDVSSDSSATIGRTPAADWRAHLAFLVYLTWVIAVGLHHEPWFDEAQAWLIARDNGFWPLFTTGVRYEGTPALWHAVLWCVQRLGLPYGGVWLVSAAFCAGGAAVILYRSPFPLWLRVGLIFSYFLAYQYAVVARSYALDVLFIPLLAMLFEARSRRPLLYGVLLSATADTNAHSFVLAAALALEWSWTCRRRILALDAHIMAAMGLYAVFAAAAALQAWPPKDINFLIPKAGDNAPLHAMILFTEAVIDRGDLWSLDGPAWPARLAGGVLTFLVLAPMAALWLKARIWALAALAFGALIGFSALKYGNAWHAGIFFLTLVFCLWISWSKRAAIGPRMGKGLVLALAALVAAQGWEALAAGARDVVSVYSPARSAADALRATPGATVGVAGFKAFALQPYLGRNAFANYDGGRPAPAYYLWRRGEAPIPGLSEDSWRLLTASNPDRLLLSSFNVMGWNGPARYIIDARRAGYCPTRLFTGAMIWKTYVMESDDMMLFDRCPPIPPTSPHP